MSEQAKPPITEESHWELWAALKERGLLYRGDIPDGFIKGWEAREASPSSPSEAQEDQVIDWKREYENLSAQEIESQARLRERLAAMLGVEAHPIGPDNLSGSLLDQIEARLSGSFSEEAIDAAAKAMWEKHDDHMPWRKWEEAAWNVREGYREDVRLALSAAADIEREGNSDP